MSTLIRLHGLGSRLVEKLSWLPPALARISVGWSFAEGGWGKLHNLEKVIAYFTELGIPAPQLQAPFVAAVELGGGVLLLLGLGTRFASVPLIATMAVAIATAKASELESWTDVFATTEFLYVVIFVWLVIAGAGPLSLDALILRKLEEAPAVV